MDPFLTATQCGLIAQIAPVLLIARIAERRLLGPITSVFSSVVSDIVMIMMLLCAMMGGIIYARNGVDDALIGALLLLAIFLPAVMIVAALLAGENSSRDS